MSGTLRYVAVEPGTLYAGPAILLVVLTGYARVALTRYPLSTPCRSGLQLVLLILGSLSVASAIALGDLAPAEGMNHASYGAVPFSVLVAFALFRFRLFEMKPVARSAVVQDLRGPVLVLDDDSSLADYSAAATRVWRETEHGVGRPLAEASGELADRLTLPPTDEGSAERTSLQSDDGVRHYSVSVSGASRRRDGGIAWHSILLRDIAGLEQSRWQLEKQNDRLDQVASTISHDLRNPISVVDGNVELAAVRLDEADVADELREAVLEQLQSVEVATERMRAIVDDVLTIAREGTTVEETEAVSLEDTARDAWATVDTKQATLRTDDGRVPRLDRRTRRRVRRRDPVRLR
ncbi:histidine kinase dimerization/phospho-acceptor domain-containing protein [Halorientalis pallida]|uniref:histidine kinase n=1 Tax=Halorientalis pallida TaxID=2479928 RepID=A0A498KZF6_9EURY|nr:histidine kinase dimerization/phospho-acceptor domain-containing protein [Halorientalis pallida]RXK46310.1 hypothetical protein EAF64_19730 [Halorientalis pallida]